MIPDEAVEAAAWALDPRTMGSGGALAEKFKEETRAEARRILEAAAPHLMASAWDEAHFAAIGCDSTCCDYMHDAPLGDMNPYRKDPDA